MKVSEQTNKQTNEQTIYVAPKSTNESRRITAAGPVRGKFHGNPPSMF